MLAQYAIYLKKGCAQVECHVTIAQVPKWHRVHQLVLCHLKAGPEVLISIGSRLSRTQLLSWMYWVHQRQQVVAWSVPMFLIVHALTLTICPLANCWSILGVKMKL